MYSNVQVTLAFVDPKVRTRPSSPKRQLRSSPHSMLDRFPMRIDELIPWMMTCEKHSQKDTMKEKPFLYLSTPEHIQWIPFLGDSIDFSVSQPIHGSLIQIYVLYNFAWFCPFFLMFLFFVRVILDIFWAFCVSRLHIYSRYQWYQ
jgi:hypothetical protein